MKKKFHENEGASRAISERNPKKRYETILSSLLGDRTGTELESHKLGHFSTSDDTSRMGVREPYVRHHAAVTRERIRVIFLPSDFPRIMIRGKWSRKIRRRFASNIEGNLLIISTAIFHIMLYSFARLVKWKEFCSISEVKSPFEICGDHFQEDCFLNRKRNALRWDAVPTISTRVQRGRFCWFSFSCDYCSVRNDRCKGKSLIT